MKMIVTYFMSHQNASRILLTFYFRVPSNRQHLTEWNNILALSRLENRSPNPRPLYHAWSRKPTNKCFYLKLFNDRKKISRDRLREISPKNKKNYVKQITHNYTWGCREPKPTILVMSTEKKEVSKRWVTRKIAFTSLHWSSRLSWFPIAKLLRAAEKNIFDRDKKLDEKKRSHFIECLKKYKS